MMGSRTKLTGLLFGVMLSGLIVVPPAFAEDALAGAGCNTCDMITAVNEMKGVITTKMDIANSEMAQAIINYLAQAEQNRYNLLMTWHVDPAPGTEVAMLAGKNLSAFQYGNLVIEKVGEKLVASLGVTSSDGTPQKNAESQIYEQLQGYYETAATDPNNTTKQREQLGVLNFANLYQRSNVAIDDASVNTLIKLITDPFPTKVSVPKEGDSAGKDTIASAAIEKAIVSVSLNTFLDMVAKRNPNASTGDKSMLQIMEDESSWRIKDANWFRELSKGSQESVLREIAQMMAFNMWMNYQQYRQNEQIAAMMAASVAAQARLASTMATMNKMLMGTQAAVLAATAEAKAQKIELEKELEENPPSTP